MPILRSNRSKVILLFGGLIAVSVGIPWKLQYNRAHHPLMTVIVRARGLIGGYHVEKVAFSADSRNIVTEDNTASLGVWDTASHRRTFWLEHGAESTDDHVPLVARPFLYDHIAKIPGFPPPPPKYPSQFPFDLQVGNYDSNIDITAPSGSLRAYLRADNLASVADTRHKRILFSTPPSTTETGGREYLDMPCAIAFSPDEKILAVASIHNDASDPHGSWRPQAQITLFNIQSGAIIQHWTWDKFQITPIGNLGFNLKTIALAFSPNGQHLAISDDAQISLWDINSASFIRSMKSDAPYGMIKQLIFFHNRSLIASSGWGDRVDIWNINSGKLVQSFYGPPSTDLIALSPDENRLASTGQDSKGQAVLQLWDVSHL